MDNLNKKIKGPNELPSNQNIKFCDGDLVLPVLWNFMDENV